MTDYRNSLIEFVERELIGPDPVDWDGLMQENGGEILVTDPPRSRYIAGILFPYESTDDEIEIREEDIGESSEGDEQEDLIDDSLTRYRTGDAMEYLEDAEELINRSNAYKQSAISLTVAVRDGDKIYVEVSAGTYSATTFKNPASGKISTRYPRKSIYWTNDDKPVIMPAPGEGIKKINVNDTGLKFDITYRHRDREKNFSIYTFTLENAKNKRGEGIRDDECFFQVKFKLISRSGSGFPPLPEGQYINIDDEDYQSNQLLYRNIRNYAIGHGCAADWDEIDGKVTWISSAIFPSYEIKPIVPNIIPGVNLEMLQMSELGDFTRTIKELRIMCNEYKSWIEQLEKKSLEIEDKFKKTAKKHISNCEKCLNRMINGVNLLQSDPTVKQAFQYMNHVMLLQQIHYNLPLQKWIEDGNGNIKLENPITRLPTVTDESTWYDSKNRVYGKWRPFQIAFILMNLNSMYDKNSDERSIVDLIWFPTGGGKTEAYLGLAAYTIFIRRLINKNDSGTAIIMRYTLRLLTAQQYERASTMICACDLIRKESEDTLGTARISIGLWVGSSTTPNSIKEAVKAYENLYSGKGDDINPFLMLKCPWCGAQMGVVQTDNNRRFLPGYKKIIEGKHNKKRIIFQCSNSEHGCDFSSTDNELPLYIIDEEIYEKTPTLLLGTVDKFAILPFRPIAQRLFGYQNGKKLFSPDLIIQDELHLISGPLGSMVGHYETLIHELCLERTIASEIRPKIVVSTATISRAREQCHALYGYGKNKIFQFPSSGLDAGDSFFAIEDKKQKGRKYVGILATGASSDTTSAIRLFSSLLYGAKEMKVDSEEMRDPYWTNIGYFNSIRELGQAATWIRADIDQHLDVMYKRRYYHKRYTEEEYKRKRRYIWRYEELTSRIRNDKVTASLENLNIKHPAETYNNGRIKDHPIDICLATNMISVGLDIPRLGLMTVAGQPKTTSEYIQATSRVGRDTEKAPGVVFVLYKPGRPRDKSHYEQFRSYHSRIYCNVEPTSVTPFSAPVRERALHAIIIGLMRLQGDEDFNNNPPRLPDKELYEQIRDVIKNRIKEIDPKELDATLNKMEYIIQCWEDWNPQKWEPVRNQYFAYENIVPLMFPAGSLRNKNWGNRGFETPISLRNVDKSCEAEVLENRYYREEL